MSGETEEQWREEIEDRGEYKLENTIPAFVAKMHLNQNDEGEFKFSKKKNGSV